MKDYKEGMLLLGTLELFSINFCFEAGCSRGIHVSVFTFYGCSKCSVKGRFFDQSQTSFFRVDEYLTTRFPAQSKKTHTLFWLGNEARELSISNFAHSKFNVV